MNVSLHAPPASREILYVAIGLAALVSGLIWVTNGAILLTRPFWVDEWFTVLVASHASPIDVIADLRHGADGGASLWHLCVWGLHAVTGSVSPISLRTLSLLFVFGALVVVYVVLRRRFTMDASIAGVVAIGSHGLVVAHAFEGRFYGLWLLCCALFAWSLSLNQHPGRRNTIFVAVASILLCASHWYGVLSLVLMSAAVMASYGRRWREGLRVIGPGAAGVIAFLMLSPLASGQRAAITVDSWIPDFTMGQLRGLASTFWTARLPAIATAALFVGILVGVKRDEGRAYKAAVRGAVGDAGIIALFALAFMPVVLAALSLAGQPSMISRYAIPAVLAWGPFVALAMELLGRWPARAFAVVVVGFLWVSFQREAGRKRAFAIGIADESRTIRQADSLQVPVVFQSLHTMYPAVASRRGKSTRAVFLDLPDSTLSILIPADSRWYQLNKGVWLERDFARVHARRFGFPGLAPQSVLDTTARFLFVVTAARLPRGVDDVTFARAAFPHHRVVPVTENLLLLERQRERSRLERNTSR